MSRRRFLTQPLATITDERMSFSPPGVGVDVMAEKDLFALDDDTLLAQGTSPGDPFGGGLAPLEEAARAHTSNPVPSASLVPPATLEPVFEAALKSFSMHYQPIVRARDWALFGYEALLRPNNAAMGSPYNMICAAEQLGRLTELGRAIRSNVGVRFADADVEHGLIFVNLHSQDLLDEDLVSKVAPLAQIAHRVVLEVTEHAPIEGLGVETVVAKLREIGFRIAIDDLGAGHSRMRHFSPANTDFVKLDMSLVRDVQDSPERQDLIRSIGRICHRQNISLIGEGVETHAEARALTRLGCDLLQGYLIAKPAPALR